MSDTTAATAHEAYAFACMRCGHGWEQAYEIEHHTDASGHAYVVYKADGERVPSPLSTPTCANCGGHVVRIMRAGRVSNIQQFLHNQNRSQPAAGPLAAGEQAEEPVAATVAPSADHHWHLSDLLHPFRK
ncbi:hypothetical protein ACIQZN_29110 [Streptomyces sp. NPDC097595]|uniref:hypothetical protein n=1 Tax=Streptomyces sp. NPDC097595 TaxID=3366090 RepID=UPI00381A7DA9